TPGEIDWIDFPTGSQKTMILRDTSFTDARNNAKGKEYSAISYQGMESVYAAEKNFNAIKIKTELNYSSSSNTESNLETQTEYIWFVPELGFFIKAEVHANDI